MQFNMEWYRVFYWTAKLGSLTKAAQKLHITQPAISHTLKQLEGSLGGPLFFRTTKGVTLTTEGVVLYNYIEQAFHLIDTGEKKISEMHELSSGSISIGASDTLCKYYLLPHLEKFHKQYPDIRIHVTNRTTSETITLLKEGKIDFGIVNLPGKDPLIDFRTSTAIQDCLVGNQKYSDVAKKTITLSELGDYPLLLLESGSHTRSFLDHYALSNGVKLIPEFELGSLDLLVQFARSGFGLTFMIREFIIEELTLGKLIEVPLFPPIPERHVGIATLKGLPLSAASKRFLEFLP